MSIKKFSKIFICIALTLAFFMPFININAVGNEEKAYIKFDVAFQNNELSLQVTSLNMTSKDMEALGTMISNTVAPAYLAVLWDNPDYGCWSDNISFKPIGHTKYNNGIPYCYVTKIEHTIFANTAYNNPHEMVGEIQAAVNAFEPVGDTMYDKVKSIHDYLCEITTYDSSAAHGHSAYGALIDGRAVCEGYAEAFKLICDANGIDCILVIGEADNSQSTGGHMWNYVRMDDGLWYAVDCTWDDAGNTANNYNYFLIGSKTIVNNTSFDISHLPDFSGASPDFIPNFSYPALSENAYTIGSTNSEYTYSGEKYYYNFLNPAQKTIYDEMYNKIMSGSITFPNVQNPPVTTQEVTTPDITTTEPEPPSVTTPGSTTSNKETDTTNPPSTTLPSGTTSSDIPQTTPSDTTSSEPPVTTPSETTTSRPPESTPEATTSQNITTTPNETTKPSVTTKTDVTTSIPNSTSLPESSKETTPASTTEEIKETSSQSTASPQTKPSSSTANPGTSTDKTQPEAKPTVTETTPVQSATPEPPSTGTSSSDNISESTVDSTQPPSSSEIPVFSETANTQNSKKVNELNRLYRIVEIIIIVFAITTICCVVGVIVFKFAKKNS